MHIIPRSVGVARVFGVFGCQGNLTWVKSSINEEFSLNTNMFFHKPKTDIFIGAYGHGFRIF